MDILKKVTQGLSKYRYAVLVLIIGLILMILPNGSQQSEESDTEESPTEQTQDVAGELTQILGQIKGVGKVQVMLTVEAGESTVYQYDESTSATDTVIITDGDRAQYGLVRQVIPPKYRGAIVVCQGADSASVRLNIIEAVAKVTGLSSDRISVLKMK